MHPWLDYPLELSFTSMETGEIFSLGDINVENSQVTFENDTEIIRDSQTGEPIHNFINKQEATISLDILNSKDFLSKILNSIPHESPSVDIDFTHKTQKRKHRKKRINKKWLKRYGYNEVRVTLYNCEHIREEDGSLIFKSKGVQV